MKLSIPLILVLLAFSIPSMVLADDSAADGSPNDSSTEQPVHGTFRNTYYYVVIESDYAAYPSDTVIRSRRGHVIARVSTRFKKALDIEGSGKLKDGRVVNYDGQVKGDIRYRVIQAPWGLGVGSCELVPFRSIAVDPKTIPIGSIVQIDETVGMVLPDGSVHDGIWKAVDIGGAIKGDRIDLFTGTQRDGKVYLVKAGIDHLQALTIRIISGPDEDDCVFQRFFQKYFEDAR